MATVDTWARHIRNTLEFEEIPQDLRAFYIADTGGYTPEIFLVYCPENERLRKTTSEKLLYLYNNALIYVERTKKGIIRIQYNTSDLYVLETGYVLLDSWMIVVGLVDGNISTTTVHFNRVVCAFFDRLVEGMRLMALGRNEKDNQADNTFALSFRRISYKYMNYIRGTIFASERIVTHIFQPLIRGIRFHIFRTALTNDHITILTENELIQITEGIGFVDRYGHTYTYFRRNRIKEIVCEDDLRDTSRIKMTVNSGGVYSRTVLFDGKQVAEAKRLASRFPSRN